MYLLRYWLKQFQKSNLFVTIHRYHLFMVLTESKKLLIISRDRELINQIRRTFNSTEISVNYQDVKRADVIIMDRRDNREIPQDRKFQSKMICIIYKVSQQEIESLSAQGVNHIITLPEFKYWLFCLLKRYLGYTNSDTSNFWIWG